MAVKGKFKTQVYLDPLPVVKVRDFLECSVQMPGWSAFVNILITEFAEQIEQAEKDGTIGDLIEAWKIYE